jgi:endoglucanase
MMLLLLALTQSADLEALTDRWLVVRVVDGRVVHRGKGQKAADERADVKRVDVARAVWTIASADDPAYAAGQKPARVGRKTQGVDFAGFVEGWKDGRTLNTRPDHVLEHAVYLALPSPLRPGATYTVTSDVLPSLSLRYGQTRSEAVHVNLMGYPTSSPAKHGYVYHWMGDVDALDVRPLEGRAFQLLERSSGAVAYTGQLKFRYAKEKAETFHLQDSPPHGNFLKADVVEADFSAFSKEGAYVLSVEGVGRSFPFRIAEDVYREAFRTTARGLYHNRSGIALVKPHTEFERPAPHNPLVTPGFKGKLVYTRSRFVDWKNGDHDAADKPAIEAGIAGPLDAWGWYQDAGDWDSYESHLVIPSILMLAWELGPSKFRDGELDLPESGNGVPDLLDEAAWLPRFCQRLRAELIQKGYGSGGIGLRVCGDHFGGDGEGVPSYLDVHRQWIVSGEDPWSTYRYAGVAAQLAWCLKKAGIADPKGVDWAKEARESWRWASTNTRPGDEERRPSAPHPLRAARAYAAAALWRLDGGEEYQKSLMKDTAWIQADTMIWHMDAWGPWIYALGGGPDERLRKSILSSCRHAAIETPSKRALRWGGNFAMPMLCGQQTTPWILEGMIGCALEPEKAKEYRAAVVTSCDYVLGTNANNTTWVTGLGARCPTEVFHLDAFYNGKGRPHPGIIPYGPWKKGKDVAMGPWEMEWAYPTLYPGIDAWPGNERWFRNRNAPLTSEFTIHQNTVHAAAAFGWLCAPAKP